MFTLAVSNEFAHWFETLDHSSARQVESSLALVAEEGVSVDPTRQGRLLLWFDSTLDLNEDITLSYGMPHLASHFAKRNAWIQRFTDVVLWHKEALRCLESPLFASALKKVDSGRAAAALQAVESIRDSWQATQRGLSAINLPGFSEPKKSEEWTIGEQVKCALERAVNVVGLDVSDVIDVENGSGLRELAVRETQPNIRIIYGLDTKRRRILALVGDLLSRCYYGDSVKLAEQRWSEYRWGAQLTRRSSEQL
jgi:hypothetical protein